MRCKGKPIPDFSNKKYRVNFKDTLDHKEYLMYEAFLIRIQIKRIEDKELTEENKLKQD